MNGVPTSAGAERVTVRRLWAWRVLTLAVGVLLPIGCLEVLARILPVHGGTGRLSVNDANPVVRFQPDREFVWSRDWNFSIINKVRINSVGFVSDFDYDPDAESPLLAVVGDSYVEAFMVPFRETCHGRLATRLDGMARVYSFGVSGAPLSQYLGYATYARETFRPDGLAIVIVANDYDESLRKHDLKRGMYQFVERSDGRLALERSDVSIRLRYRLVRASALARYVMINLGVTRSRVQRLVTGENARERARQEELEGTRIADSMRVVDAFLDQLPEASGLEPGKIVFIVDGIRSRVYGNDGLESPELNYMDTMRRYFMANARRMGYETIDLEPAFVEHYGIHAERFDWPQDGHWNALGHEVCFRALAGSALVSGGFAGGGDLLRSGEG